MTLMYPARGPMTDVESRPTSSTCRGERVAWAAARRIVYKKQSSEPNLQSGAKLQPRDSTAPVHLHFRKPIVLTSTLIVEQGIKEHSDVQNHLVARAEHAQLVILVRSRDKKRDIYIIPQEEGSKALEPAMLWDEDLLCQLSSLLSPTLILPAETNDDLKFRSEVGSWSCYLVNVEQGSFGPDEDADVLFPNLLTIQTGASDTRSAHNVGSVMHLLEWLAEPTVERIEAHLSNLINSGLGDESASLKPRWSGSWCYERLKGSWGKEALDKLGITVKTVTNRCIADIDRRLTT